MLNDRPWVRGSLAPTPAAQRRAKRLRPLIYVYDMPAEFTTRMLQYRVERCVLCGLFVY